jgi:hypothetical protein
VTRTCHASGKGKMACTRTVSRSSTDLLEKPAFHVQAQHSRSIDQVADYEAHRRW